MASSRAIDSDELMGDVFMGWGTGITGKSAAK